MEWHLLGESSPGRCIGEASWNMALDAVSLQRVTANRSIPRVRLYQWQGPAVTLGRFQDPATALNVDACRQFNVSVARRPTGGRGIVHGADLTLSLAAGLNDLSLDPDTSISSLYADLGSMFVSAFAAIGVVAARGECHTGREARSPDCMASACRADVVEKSSGIKLLGAALLRSRDCFLMQCTIPVNDATAAPLLRADQLFRPSPRRAPALSSRIPAEEVRVAVVEALTLRLGSPPTLTEVCSVDSARAAERASEFALDPSRVTAERRAIDR